jgi:ribosomal protein S6--L-glutamate ligase
MIIERFSQLMKSYDRLNAGDVYVGLIPSAHLKTAMMVDLAARGVTLLPSAVAQVANGSKAAQTFLLAPFMPPHSLVIGRRKELLDALNHYQRLNIAGAVTKSDRQHCGHGIRRWDNLETLYNCLSLCAEAYPFVLQPFIEGFNDVRVIIAGEFREAYSRRNEYGFRQNLAAGGVSVPWRLGAEELDFCKRVMARGQMPYAHLDLMITADGKIYLSEIRLNGGIHGAAISRTELEKIKRNELMKLAERALPDNKDT